MAKNKLCIEFANETGVYPINVGTTFTDVFGETLDSASVIISKIPRKLDIKPNDEVRIFNESGFIFGEANKYYLVDSVYCKEITLNDTKQYQYTLELKSLTSYLDLIQLPNRALNHSLVKGQKLILDYIEQFVFLYAPKIKTKVLNEWHYAPLFEIDENWQKNDESPTFIEKFSVPCMDLNFSQPTLRQVLTSLMLQVGCLPKIEKIGDKNYLTFLDLREKPLEFKVEDNSLNYTNYSLASDSYVNTLVNMGDNILDDDNVVITETIGFRDTNNVLLKQKENLKLNTIYPIYDVEKLVIKVPIQTNAKIKSENLFGEHRVYVGENAEGNALIIDGADFLSNLNRMKFDTTQTKVYVYNRDENGKLVFDSVREIDGNIITSQNNILVSNVAYNFNSIYVLSGVISELVYNDGTTFENVNITTTNFETDVVIDTYYYFFERDITELCVERNKRNLLDTDFLEMNQATNIHELSKYLYGTVAYDIGGKTIEGFSSTYNEFVIVDFWDGTRTYIENMYGKIMRVDNYITPNIDTQIREQVGTMPDKIGIVATDFVALTYEGAQLFTSLLFDITYKPLNSLRINHIKEEEQNYRLEQLDTGENAIANFNDVVRVEQQKVNRLGNEIVVRNQRTEYSSQINDLNTYFDDYIVFSRVVSVGIEDFKVNYTASKNYVLQNYFTAIQTKYRAYEYTNYGQSVVRKENTTIFGRIGRDYYDGDDNIYFGVKRELNNRNLQHIFLSGVVNQYDNQYLYKCASVGDDWGIGAYKTDLSIMVAENTIAFATQDFDSVSYGIAVDLNHENYNTLSGLPQRWIMKGESGFDKVSHSLLNSDFSNTNLLQDSEEELKNTIKNSFSMPLIKNANFENSLNLVDYNKTEYYTALAKTFYLDKQEVLNNTIQFVFYATDDSILWTEKLWKMSWFVNREKPKGKRYFYIPSEDEEFGINKTSYTSIDTSKLKNVSFDSYELKFDENGALRIRWSYIGDNLKWTKVVYEEDGKYYDLLAIKNVNNARSELIYITLNDTKTDKVAYHKNGLLSFNEYVVAKNTLNREANKL